ncbi:MAG: hypothetical protein ABI240_09945 [Sphingomonas sp.]
MGENRLAGFARRAPHSQASVAQTLRDPLLGDEALPAGPQLRLVPDTLEMLLSRVIANLRSSLPNSAVAESEFGSACRRDAIAVIEAGHAAGLLQARKGRLTSQG